MRKLLFFCGLGLLICCSGCTTGMIGALATPTPYEIKIPPEYNLNENKPQKILVLVEQPGWATSGGNIRVCLTGAIAAALVDEVDLKAETIVPYRELADMRNSKPDFEMLSPVQVGKTFNAQLVLYVVIDKFGLYGLSDAGYYNGNLTARSGLYDVATGRTLWPQQDELKTYSVGFELQKGENEAAMRLAKAMARCIIRNLYDCSKKEYKVDDESVTEDTKGW